MRPYGTGILLRRRMPPECGVVLAQCIRRVQMWKPPPHWSAADWREEARLEAAAAAHEALCRFDPSRGIELRWYVRRRVLQRVLARYRKEWAFGLRWSSSDDDGPTSGLVAQPIAPADLPSLRSALNALSLTDRDLMEALFWDRLSETEIARKMGISQQAVSRRKLIVLRELRRALDRDR